MTQTMFLLFKALKISGDISEPVKKLAAAVLARRAFGFVNDEITYLILLESVENGRDLDAAIVELGRHTEELLKELHGGPVGRLCLN